MTTSNPNYGVSISGGTVNAGAIAGGTAAVASSHGSPGQSISIEQLRRLMSDLAAQVSREADTLPDGDQAVTVAQLAEQEAAKERPDRSRLLAFLAVLARGVGSVASLAGSVVAVEQAVTKIL